QQGGLDANLPFGGRHGAGCEQRHAVRQERIKPLVAALEGWMRTERVRLSRHADTAKAIDYMLKRWPAFAAATLRTPAARPSPTRPIRAIPRSSVCGPAEPIGRCSHKS